MTFKGSIKKRPEMADAGADDTAIAVLLVTTVSLAVSLDHIWYGPLPAWLIAAVFSGIMLLTSPSRQASLVRFYQLSKSHIIVPWCIFILVIAITDSMNGRLADNLSKRILLNVAALGMMIVVGASVSRVKRSMFIYALAVIAACQGVVAIGQFLKAPGCWDFPTAIVGLVGGSTEKAAGTELTFERVGRVRGMNLFVHMFNATQGIVATFLASFLILNQSSLKPLNVRSTILLPLVIVAGMGVLLTFSRSTLLGGGLAFVLILWKERKQSTALIMCTLMIFGALAANLLDLQGAKEFNRVNNFAGSRHSNHSRLLQYEYAFHRFAESPLIGSESNRARLSVPVHSVALRLLCDNGLVGFAAYAAVLFGVFFLLHRQSSSTNPQVRIIALSGIAGMTVALVDSLTHSSGLLVRSVAQPAYVGVFLGLALGFETKNMKPQTNHTLVLRSSRR